MWKDKYSEYFSTRLLLPLFALILVLSLCFIPNDIALADCSRNWNVSGASGVSSTYQPGQTVSGSFSYQLNNSTSEPGVIQQILVGIVDQSGHSYGVSCAYDGTPAVCPDSTTGSYSFSFSAPSNPGNYSVIAALDMHYGCSQAMGQFPSQGSKKVLASFSVSQPTPQCNRNWNVGGASGVSSTYQPGQTVSGSFSYQLNNSTSEPGVIQQILVGIVDQSGHSYGVSCAYDGTPAVCPDSTTGSYSFSFSAPSNPGNYSVIAALDMHYGCSQAMGQFPNQGSKKVLTSFSVSQPTPQCSRNWNAGSASGVSSTYQPGQTVSGSFSYQLNNSTSEPGVIQQILVGIVDQSGQSYGVSCAYDGTPAVCPDSTSGSYSFSFSAPSNPGNYSVIAALDMHYGCSQAMGQFPSQGNKKQLATITVSGGQPESKDVRFRGTVTTLFLPDYEVKVEQIIDDPTGHLAIGDLAWVTAVNQSCVKGTINVGDYVEVYGKTTAKLPGKPQLWLETAEHYIKVISPQPSALQASLAVSPMSGDTSTQFIFSISIQGGTSLYTVNLRDRSSQDLAPSQSGRSSTYTFKYTFSTPGTYYVHGFARDATGNTAGTNEASIVIKSGITVTPADIASTYSQTLFNQNYWAKKQGEALSRFSDDFIEGLFDPLDMLASMLGIETYGDAAMAIEEFVTIGSVCQAADYSTLFFLCPMLKCHLQYDFGQGFSELASLLQAGADTTSKAAELRSNLQILSQCIDQCPSSGLLMCSMAGEKACQNLLNSAKSAVESAISFLDGLSKEAPSTTTSQISNLLDDYLQNKPSESIGGKVPATEDVSEHMDRYFQTPGPTTEVPPSVTTSGTSSQVFGILDAYFQEKPSELTAGKVPTTEEVFQYLDSYFGR
jgi:hypothetical protein